MTGYCSNSPLRCSKAMSMTILSETSNSCPQCGLALVSDTSNSGSVIEQRVLKLGLVVFILLLLALIYIYYGILGCVPNSKK